MVAFEDEGSVAVWLDLELPITPCLKVLAFGWTLVSLGRSIEKPHRVKTWFIMKQKKNKERETELEGMFGRAY